jgi:two-component system OmpR family sensor kinase
VSRLARLPIRLRVTLAFTTVMALVLAAVGLFVYLRLGKELDATTDEGLRSRSADLIALVKEADIGVEKQPRSPLTARAGNLAQILDTSGRIVDATPALRARPALSTGELRRAFRGPITLVKPYAGDEGARYLAAPALVAGRKRLVVVVGTPLNGRDDAIASVGALLLIGGPIALLLAALAGYGALTAALAPVESMRRRAAGIHHAAPGARLPVPPTHDEISRLGETLNEMLARLEDAFARERAFVADASHELRTPLAILKGELELALRDGRTAAELQAALRSAAEETDRVVQLAEDLLVMARSDQGRLPIRRSEVDAAEVLETVRRRFWQRARDHGVELTVGAEGGLRLAADPMRLEQALGNLVDNALRHGGRRIALEAVADGGVAALHVRDDGPGFPEDFIPKAFDRFTRADAGRARGGAGLGLAIVEAIARAHGGAVHAVNAPEGGADVWLELPGAATAPRAPAVPQLS